MNIRRFLKALTDFMFTLVLMLLGLRFVLRLFGANQQNSFVSWTYDTSGEILGPFRTIFPKQQIYESFVIEFSTVFAIIVYGLLTLTVFRLIEFFGSSNNNERV